MIKEKYSITDKLGFVISACDVTGSFSQPFDQVKVKGGALPLLILSIPEN